MDRACSGFFEFMASQYQGVTFDDVLVLPGRTNVLPPDVNVRSYFSKNVPVNAPIISSPMDTATMAPMAIAMAKLGGLGIIHRNLTPDEQAREVAKVKHNLNALVVNPITVFDDETVTQVLARRDERAYAFHTFPVLSRDGAFRGLMTARKFSFCPDHSALIADVMEKDPVVGKRGTTLNEAHALMQARQVNSLPLVDNGKLVGLYLFNDVHRVLSGNCAAYNVDENGQLRVGAAVGVLADAQSRLELLMHENVDVIVIDTAHGDSEPVYNTLKWIKDHFGVDVVAGNISMREAAECLVRSGADGLRIGQGAGSICTTRVVAGIGCPQLTAIYECSVGAGGIPICADGGISYSGDMVKALAAGASTVMVGSIVASTDEAPGEIIMDERGRRLKRYRGMGSPSAMKESAACRQRYGQQAVAKPVAEGVEGAVECRGPVADVLAQYIGGIRSGMAYVGAQSIPDLHVKARFIRQSAEGLKESHPHDLAVMVAAPNYAGR